MPRASLPSSSSAEQIIYNKNERKVEFVNVNIPENNVSIFISNVQYMVKCDEIQAYCEKYYGALHEQNGIYQSGPGLFFVKFKNKQSVDSFMDDRPKHKLGFRQWSCKRMFEKNKYENCPGRYQVSNFLSITLLEIDKNQVLDIGVIFQAFRAQGRIISVKEQEKSTKFIVEFDDYDTVDKILLENTDRNKIILNIPTKLEKHLEKVTSTENSGNKESRQLEAELHHLRLGNHALRRREERLEEEIKYLRRKREMTTNEVSDHDIRTECDDLMVVDRDNTSCSINGTIVRIRLEHFMAYDSQEMYPDPGLNMIIESDGSGKSSLLCAIHLALCGSIDTSDSAQNVSEYIKSGCEKATVEIE
ncbi:unnamed protein product, partial [Didymodactylos carnosus]